MSMSFTAPRMERSEADEELARMTEEQRQHARNDLYGLSLPIEETPELVASKLQRMDEILMTEIPDKKKIQFLTAQKECPDYVNDDQFRLRFLRTDYFDEKAAASRMCSYWAEKVALFGDERAYRKLRAGDLNEDDLVPAQSDSFLLLPNLDRSGRAIFFSMRPKWRYPKRENLRRWFWYLIECAIENESVQMNGAICVSFDDGPFSVSKFDRKLEAKLFQMTTNSMPIRACALHHCFDSKIHEILIPFYLFMMGPSIRARYRTYPGKKRHTRLQQFEEMGMSSKILPKEMGGELSFDVMAWLDERIKHDL